MKDITVSILIPCYNQANYIAETLDSVLAQTYPHWEAIVINDGSPDNTREVVSPYVEKDMRIRYIEIPNGGVSAARNRALQEAKAEWVVPLDADDRLMPTFLEETLQAAKTYTDATVIATEVNYFDGKSGRMDVGFKDYRTQLFKNQIVCTCLFRKADALAINGYDEDMHIGLEDWEFFIRLLYKDKRVVMLPRILFEYRIKLVSRNCCCKDSQKEEALYAYVYKKHIDKYLEYFGNPIDMLIRFDIIRRQREKHKSRWYRKLFYLIFKNKSKSRT